MSASSSYAAFTTNYGQHWKSTVTQRGLTYRYLSVPAGSRRVVLLVMHGFMSSVYSWHALFDYFREKGYGILAPDMLGYGGTDKPEDTKLYQHTGQGNDMMDIVAAEVPDDVHIVAVAHDWGVAVMNRLVCHHGKRFKGFAFLTVCYMGPNPDPPYNLSDILSLSRQINGGELYAYWELYVKPGVVKICEENIESLIDVHYAEDAYRVWTKIMFTRHEALKFVTNGKRLPRAKFLSDEEYDLIRDHLVGPGRGLWGPFAWFKMWMDGHHASEDRELMRQGLASIKIQQPVIYMNGLQDAVCTQHWMRPLMEKVSLNLTVVLFDTCRWIHLSQPDKLNAELDKWLEARVLRTCL